MPIRTTPNQAHLLPSAGVLCMTSALCTDRKLIGRVRRSAAAGCLPSGKVLPTSFTPPPNTPPRAMCQPDATSCSGRGGCNGSRCRLLTHACVFNATVYHYDEQRSGWQPVHAKIRIPWNSHHVRSYDELNAQHDVAQPVLAKLFHSAHVLNTSCEPPVAWVPVWSTNYADSFYSSVVPLVEMEATGLVHAGRRTLLLADSLLKHMHPRCRSESNGPCHTPSWFRTLLSLVTERFLFTHEVAPRCSAARSTAAGHAAGHAAGLEGASGLEACPPPVCYSHAHFCTLRSMFDRPTPNLDVWSSAQRLVAAQLRQSPKSPMANDSGVVADSSGHEHEAARTVTAAARTATPRLRILFERRTAKGMKGRALGNVDELLASCSLDGTLECEAHSFGLEGLAEDMRRVRRADVLVGLHGAGLTNAWFMRRRSVLIEVRPYGFDGGWPDSYFRNPIRAVSPPRLYHMALSIGSPSLCRPDRGFAVTAGEAVMARACDLPWHSLRHALDIVRWWREGSKGTADSRYIGGAWASKNIVAYPPSSRSSSIQRRGGGEASVSVRHGTQDPSTRPGVS